MPFNLGRARRLIPSNIRIRVSILTSVLAAQLVLLPAVPARASHDWLDIASYGRWRALRSSTAPPSGQDRRFELMDMNKDGRLDFATNVTGGVVSALGNADGTFQTLQFFGDGVSPKGSFAMGDLNCDGAPDAVTADINTGETTVSVFLGNGAGGFGPRTGFTAGSGRRWLALGDVNRDGRLDLALASQPTGGPYSVVIALGNGVGGFGAATSYAETSPPSEITLADLNVDGKLDMVWIQSSPNQVSYRLGNGDGTFAAATRLIAGGLILDVQTPDLNRDGRPDLLWTRSGGSAPDTASIALGLGGGGFGAPATLVLSGDSDVLAVGDFNEDGKPDLVALMKDGRGFYLGHGDGTFDAPIVEPGIPINFTLTNVRVADLDQDGHQDIVYSLPAVDFGNGDGTFGEAQPLTTAAGPSAVAFVTMNGDALPDLVVTCRGANVASVFLNTGGNTFGARSDFAIGAGAAGICSADFNGDGLKDIATANETANTVSVLLNNGAGGFLPKTDFPTGTTPVSIRTDDLNGDTKADLVVVNQSGPSVSVLIGSGTGSFAAKVDYPTTNLTPTDVVIADFNNDAKKDLAIAGSLSGAGGVLIRLGNGDGTFGAETSFETNKPKRSLAAGDFNGDGKIDLAASDLMFQVTTFLGNGNGTFGAGTLYFTNSNAFAMESSDLDGDGKLDLVLGHSFGYVWALEGTGAGDFVDGNYGFAGRGSIGTLFAGHQMVAVGDYQNDGRKDLAVVGETTNSLTLLRNRGAAVHPIAQNGWLAPQPFTSQAGPRAIAAADFNRDGKFDAASAATGPNQVSVLLGTGSGTLGPGNGFNASPSIRSIATADLNKDGILDAASVGANGILSILPGNGSGGFGPKTDTTAGGTVHDLDLGDIDGNGTVDVVLDDSASGNLKAYSGAGNGTVSGPTLSPLSSGAGCASIDLDLADVNCDGKLDAIAATGACGHVDVLFGNGAMAFAGSALTMGSQPGSVVVADLNQDGKPDLAAADLVGSSVIVRLNNPASPGTFLAAVTYTGINVPTDIAAADVDQDGDLDLLVGSSGQNAFAVLKGNGDGTFTGRTVYGMNGPVTGITAIDLNHDGLLDVVAALGNSNALGVRLGQRSTVTAVETPPVNAVYALAQNRPNPFNPTTKIQFTVGRAEPVRLQVFDASGRLVATLMNRTVASGLHEVSWTGRNDQGLPVASGVYFYRLEAGEFSKSKRMVLLK